MIYAKFDDNGFPLGFWIEEAYEKPEEIIPTDAIIITENQHLEFMENSGSRRFVDGEVLEVPQVIREASVSDYENAIQELVEETARSRQFRDAATMASYTASTVPSWAAQAQAFVAWRDSVWLYAYEELANVKAGARYKPTVDGFLSELPEIVWPE